MDHSFKQYQMATFDGWTPLMRQWKIGAFITLLSFGGACAIITQLTPVYKAYAQLLLPLKLVEDPGSHKSTMPQQADALVAKSFADIIKDDGIARTVIKNNDLTKNVEFQPRPNIISDSVALINQYFPSKESKESLFSQKELENDRVLQDYEGRLKAVAESKALTILLSFEARDPHLAEAIVNAHARGFVQSEIDYRRQDANAKLRWMKGELDRTAAEARDAQVAIQLNPTALTASKDLSAGAVSLLKMRQLEATATQAVYDSVLKRYQDAVADEAYSGSEIRILSAATVPTHPFFPRRLLLAGVAAALSLILGFAAAAIASVARRKISVDAIVESLELPILASINIPRRAWSAIGQQGRTERALFWQRVHEIRSTIDVSGKRHPVVLVTSVMPKEGKSLVASALARTLAGSGLRTLLIDLNGRNPRYRASLDRRTWSPLGLQQYLDGDATAEQAAVRVGGASPLYLMASKSAAATDLASLTGPKLKGRISALKKDFDAVVIDAPALSSLSDSLQLAAHTDEIILTVLAGNEQLKKMQEDVAKLRTRSTKLKGIVVVDKMAPDAEDLACLEGYALQDDSRDIWPKAKPLSLSEKDFFRRLFGRRIDNKQVGASI